jgi:Fic family protein
VGLNTIEYNERTAKRKTKCSGLIKPFKKHCHFNIQPSRLRPDQVRSSIARRLGIEIAGEVSSTAIAHLWFVTIHPFDDGNGRIARAIADMQLARADASRQRFYSMSAQIQRERNVYYDILEKTQTGNLDITKWLLWFIECLDRAISLSEENLSGITQKAKFWESHQAVAFNERQRKMLNKLMDGFDRVSPSALAVAEGKLTSSKWAKIAKCSPDTALRDIQDLIEKGILEKEEGGGRSTSYRIRG